MYFDHANNYWVAAVSLGYKAGKRVRRKVTGRTKTEVKAKLRDLRRDLDNGVRPNATYTVGAALDDWLANGLSGRSDRTRELYTDTVKRLREQLGEVKLKELTAGDVQETLDGLAIRLSTRSLQINGTASSGPSGTLKSATSLAGTWLPWSRLLPRAGDLPRADTGAGSGTPAGGWASRLYAYVVLSVMTGLRTEELRALRWAEVDLGAGTVAVYRAVRATTDTKTPKSRRVLLLPRLAVQALREHLDRQDEDRLLAGALWQDHGLVFASSIGTPLDHSNVRREFRRITDAAGLGTDWVPREMRHTFVSLLSSNGTALGGHSRPGWAQGNRNDRDGLPEKRSCPDDGAVPRSWTCCARPDRQPVSSRRGFSWGASQGHGKVAHAV